MDHLYKINCLPSPNSLFKLRTGSNIFFFKLHETFNIKLFSLKRNRIDKQLYISKQNWWCYFKISKFVYFFISWLWKGKKNPLFKGIYVALRERQNISMNMNKIICNTEKVSTITSTCIIKLQIFKKKSILVSWLFEYVHC